MIRRVVRADGSVGWQARYGKKGVAATFDLKYQAEEYEAEQKKNARRAKAGLDYEQRPIDFNELATLYKQNFDPSAWRLSMLAYAEGRWGDVMVRQIKPEAVGAWLHGLPYSGKTKKHILETLRQVFNAGVEWGYLSRSPAKPGAFKSPSEKRVRPIRPFASWEEVERVAKAAGHYGPLIRFVCATGLRTPSEWIDLTWRDVNVQERLLTVNGTKTDNAARTIPLTRRALDALAEMPKELGPIFKGKRGGRIDYRGFARWAWTDALAAADVEYRTPYEMRHTFATLALEAGAHIEDVSRVLGHANIDITRRYYAKWTKPRLDRFRDLLDASTQRSEESDAASTQ
jgi:integrase